MKKLLWPALVCALLLGFQPVLAEESPVGVWKTIDDDGKTAKSHVRIYERDGELCGEIVRLLREPYDRVCEECPGDLKGKPMVGLRIISALKKDGSKYTGGTIMDPENGKTYDCKIWREGDVLKVRGYVAFFYRTQEWQLVE